MAAPKFELSLGRTGCKSGRKWCWSVEVASLHLDGSTFTQRGAVRRTARAVRRLKKLL